VLFSAGSAGLAPAASEEFAKVAEFVLLYSPSKLLIDGHTDSDGDARANKELSEKRAKAVKQVLVEDNDFITDSMVEARGYGEERPMVNNDTPANKALNRRIEVLVWQ
jgi:outer membrane protein OmpA-like peptidoglycan-associated protein